MTAIRRTDPQITLLSETDVRGRILFVNDAFCEVSKYSRSELLGKPHSIIRHPDMPRSLFECLWNSILNGETFRGVIKNRAADGSAYWVHAMIMAIRDHDKKIEKCIGLRHLIADEELAGRLFEEQVKAMKL
jgi:PAS domain S-box-containing protein